MIWPQTLRYTGSQRLSPLYGLVEFTLFMAFIIQNAPSTRPSDPGNVNPINSRTKTRKKVCPTAQHYTTNRALAGGQNAQCDRAIWMRRCLMRAPSLQVRGIRRGRTPKSHDVLRLHPPPSLLGGRAYELVQVKRRNISPPRILLAPSTPMSRI